MARLFGLIGNRADLAGRVLALEGECLRARSHGGALGWGIGFFQGGEVLMRRRPLDDRGDIDVAKIAADVKADVIIGHVRAATVGALRTENTHPFRYRQWLFAQTGTIPHFDSIRERLVASVPEFLRSGIRGETDSETLFHVFLSFLHDAGRLNDMVVEAAVTREAMRSTLAVVDGTAAEVGAEPAELNVLVTNGEHIVALHRSRPMYYRIVSGKADGELLLGEDLQMRRRTAELAQMHFVLVASDFDEPPPSRWKPITERAMVTLTRVQEPLVEPF